MSAGETTLFIKKAPSVQVRAKILTWPHAKTPASSLVIEPGDVYQQETVKKVYAGS